MKYVTTDQHNWEPTPFDGLEKCILWEEGHDTTAVLVRAQKGCHFPPHPNPDYEHLTVVSGKWKMDDHVLAPGDYVITEPGETHEETALEDTVLMVTVGRDKLGF